MPSGCGPPDRTAVQGAIPLCIAEVESPQKDREVYVQSEQKADLKSRYRLRNKSEGPYSATFFPMKYHIRLFTDVTTASEYAV